MKDEVRKTHVLLDRLLALGISTVEAPRLVKDIQTAYWLNPSASVKRINDRLHFLGWRGLDLDYHTISLMMEVSLLQAEEPNLSRA